MKAGSFFCEETLSLEIFWSCYKLLSSDSSKSLEPFCLQRVFNILPAPLTIISPVWGRGCGREDDGNVCGSVSWRLLKVATWKRTLVEPLTLSMRVKVKKKQSCHSVCWVFFVLFHGLWQGGMNQCIGRKLCMWPSSPFLNWWIMCHLDCVKTVQSGEVVFRVEFDINCTYSMSIWMRPSMSSLKREIPL